MWKPSINMLKKIIQYIGLFILFVVVALATAWALLAFWFKLPGSDIFRWSVIGAFGGLGLATLVAMFRPVRWRWISIYSVALVVIIGWWNTLPVPTSLDWIADVAHHSTGTIEGDKLTVQNVRAFERRSADDYTEHWVTRSYDLTQLATVDLFLSFWDSPKIGHLLLSFGFEDGRHLTFSYEVRRSTSSAGFSPLADFFKAHPIVLIASEEHDIVGLRSNIRKERVQIFQLRTNPTQRRDLIEAYTAASRDLAQNPRWFNSAFTNCSRSVVVLAREAGAVLPIDWRILVNGYLPDYMYDLGALNTDVSLQEIIRRGDITERANAIELTDAYSAAIREGLPPR